MKYTPLRALAALALLATSTAATANSSVWTLGGEAPRTTLTFARPGAATPVMRFTCEPAGTTILVPTRAPRFGDTSGNPTPSNLSFIIGSTEAVVPSTLSRTEAGWQVVGPVPDLPRLLGAMRANSRFAVVHHAGRSKATSPSEPLLAEFEKRCTAVALSR